MVGYCIGGLFQQSPEQQYLFKLERGIDLQYIVVKGISSTLTEMMIPGKLHGQFCVNEL